jgi:hypothetical protein
MNSPFFKMSLMIITGCISTLLDTVRKDTYEKQCEEQWSSEILIECIEILCNLIGEKDYYDTFMYY